MKNYNLPESVYTLKYIGKLISANLNTIDRLYNSPLGETEMFFRLFVPVSSWNIILINSFLDEYNIYFNSINKEEKRRVKEFKIKVKPAVDRLNNWKDLKNVRNKALAHQFRDKKKGNRSLLLDGEMHDFDFPNTANDFRVASGAIIIICKKLREEFKEELEQVEFSLKPLRPTNGYSYNIAATNIEVNALKIMIDHN